ncbi:hypothetical protein HJG60_010852 [Phyllostomus discolor]|uniref:Uncharacterized protein n=1 Tax=Phyllostomus discolor TaxID=89673 RepID=A0A834AE05_9CHIR|nr:hypothetical protein HJG60_010852 [Phyllostomus discolor]
MGLVSLYKLKGASAEIQGPWLPEFACEESQDMVWLDRREEAQGFLNAATLPLHCCGVRNSQSCALPQKDKAELATSDVLRASRSLVSCPLSFHDCARGPITYVFPRIQSWHHPPEPSSYWNQTCCLENEMPHVPASSNTGPDLGAPDVPISSVCSGPSLRGSPAPSWTLQAVFLPRPHPMSCFMATWYRTLLAWPCVAVMCTYVSACVYV